MFMPNKEFLREVWLIIRNLLVCFLIFLLICIVVYPIESFLARKQCRLISLIEENKPREDCCPVSVDWQYKAIYSRNETPTPFTVISYMCSDGTKTEEITGHVPLSALTEGEC